MTAISINIHFSVSSQIEYMGLRTTNLWFNDCLVRYRLDLMSESISRKEVVHVANLARLALTQEEELLYTEQLGAILDHARDIMALQTEDLVPTAHPLELKNVFRPDVVVPSLEREEVLSQAPASEDGKFLVPRILGEAP